MKDLLTAIQTQLKTDLTYIRDSDIYITPHENYIPGQVRFPCVGIKDGAVARTELTRGEVVESDRAVLIIAYVKLAKPEAAVMGDDATGKKGVLDIINDIHDSLHDNKLGLTGMSHVFCPSEDPSDLFGEENEYIQKKAVRYEYTQEEIIS